MTSSTDPPAIFDTKKTASPNTPQNHWFWYAAIGGFMIVFLILVFLLFFQSTPLQDPVATTLRSHYRFVAQDKEISPATYFVANEATVANHLEAIRKEKTFIIAPDFVERGGYNQSMTSALVLFSTVFLSVLPKDANVVTLALQRNSEGTLESCQTNWGDQKLNQTISPNHCQTLLDSPDFVVIRVLPPPVVSKSYHVIEFKQQQVMITPGNEKGISEASHAFLLALYENTPEILAKIKSFLANLKNGS